jgi:hypothetical protein
MKTKQRRATPAITPHRAEPGGPGQPISAISRQQDGQADLLSACQAARRLGVSVTTLYDWLGLSDHGLLIIRGQPVTVEYFQGGPQGQGRIRIEASEVERIIELMRVHPQRARPVRRPVPRQAFPGITVPLGRPDGHP